MPEINLILINSAPLGIKPPRQGWCGETSKCGAKRIQFSYQKANGRAANVFKEDIEKCLNVGMDGHLGKPLDLEEIFNKLRFYLFS
jgi:hypothetical protein